MKFPLYIAKRYLFSKGSTQAINIITKIAAIGIILGALCLFVVLSAFDGLVDLHLNYTSIADPDLKLFPAKGKIINLTNVQRRKLEQLTDIAYYAPTVESRVILNYKQKKINAIIKGIDSSYTKVIPTDSLLAYGNWFPNKEAFVVLGNQLSDQLSLGINNYESLLDIYAPKPGKGQVTSLLDAFRRKGVVVSGLYQLTADLDNKYVFANIKLAKQLLNLKKEAFSHIEIKLKPNANTEILRAELLEIFNNQVVVKNRIQLNDAVYKMLNTEHMAVYLVFTLVLIVALFNLIGAMIMMIIDKKRNLQTLYKLGASLPEIRSIFFLQGMLMTILGGIIGVALGTLLVYLQQQTSAVMITPYLAYPTKLKFTNVIIVLATLYVLRLIASAISALSIKKELLNK